MKPNDPVTSISDNEINKELTEALMSLYEAKQLCNVSSKLVTLTSKQRFGVNLSAL